MSKELDAAIKYLHNELELLTMKFIEIKKTINLLNQLTGKPSQFTDEELKRPK